MAELAMRFAYADPPYPGQSKHWYRDHPDYAGEVDHAELVARLCRDYPDGWALSTNANSLRSVLILCPPEARVAIWHRTNEQPPGWRRDRWHLVYEPVIIQGGRKDGPVVRNVLASGTLVGAYAARYGHVIPGQKPPAFCRWLFALLGAQPGDTVDDLFPGSGAVSHEWDAYCAQPWLPDAQPYSGRQARVRQARHLARMGMPTLDDAQ